MLDTLPLPVTVTENRAFGSHAHKRIISLSTGIVAVYDVRKPITCAVADRPLTAAELVAIQRSC